MLKNRTFNSVLSLTLQTELMAYSFFHDILFDERKFLAHVTNIAKIFTYLSTRWDVALGQVYCVISEPVVPVKNSL